MESYNIYQDIATRTNGDIYVGVVGPVRTGKSTFIKKFMDLLVIPNIENAYSQERAKDELPQSAAGKTIMTTEPKFIPNEAVEITLGSESKMKVRMIDCVGYIVESAQGHLEDDAPRMVSTPWAKEPIPFGEAAEIGTKKVITEHSTIGLVITTDGSITDIPREDYVEAEQRVVDELKAINKPFVILLNTKDPEKAETEEQSEEYLEVLSRQSQRLKKLIEDLMEMSKASTGNIAVELGQVNAVEAVNQALGEFSEKLEQAQLSPVFQPPEEPLMMVADGRLTWRVLSNLLSNAVKYAMPGTRLYIDLVAVNGQVLISLKNISKEQLNVSTDELMERFVRGDASRNTEGSGLGLNIAKSLMELQKGQLQLLVDGDLFKATLLFPQR